MKKSTPTLESFKEWLKEARYSRKTMQTGRASLGDYYKFLTGKNPTSAHTWDGNFAHFRRWCKEEGTQFYHEQISPNLKELGIVAVHCADYGRDMLFKLEVKNR